jgi:hypothetical protein
MQLVFVNKREPDRIATRWQKAIFSGGWISSDAVNNLNFNIKIKTAKNCKNKITLQNIETF